MKSSAKKAAAAALMKVGSMAMGNQGTSSKMPLIPIEPFSFGNWVYEKPMPRRRKAK